METTRKKRGIGDAAAAGDKEKYGQWLDKPTAPLRPQRVFEKVYDQIRDDVAGGKLRPGDKLPSERDFAERLGFSRSAVREALRALEASGILHLRKGGSGGAYIRSGDDRDAIHRSLHDVVVLGEIPLADVTSVRAILMARAVELATRNGANAQFDQIEANIADTVAAAEHKDEAALLAYHADFFKIIGECAGNPFLALLIEATTAVALRLVAALHVQMTEELIILRQEVLLSLRARDQSSAVRTMSEMLAFQHGYVTGHARSAPATGSAARPVPSASVPTPASKSGGARKRRGPRPDFSAAG